MTQIDLLFLFLRLPTASIRFTTGNSVLKFTVKRRGHMGHKSIETHGLLLHTDHNDEVYMRSFIPKCGNSYGLTVIFRIRFRLLNFEREIIFSSCHSSSNTS